MEPLILLFSEFSSQNQKWPEVATYIANDVLMSPTMFDNQNRNIVFTNYGDRLKIEDSCQGGS